jgi:hypothetical protein
MDMRLASERSNWQHYNTSIKRRDFTSEENFIGALNVSLKINTMEFMNLTTKRKGNHKIKRKHNGVMA